MKTTAEFCYVLNGKGSAKTRSLSSISSSVKEPVWVHIDYANAENQDWLKKQHLSAAVLENLLDSDTTPRFFKEKGGVLVVLRGVNVRDDEEDDMISVHVWMTKKRLLTLSHRSLPTIVKLMDDFRRGRGPKSIQDCFVELTRQMNMRIENTLVKINDEGDELEETIIGDTTFHQDADLRQRLSVLRHKVVGLRRYLVPQRDMMSKLCMETSVFSEENILKLQEVARDLSAVVSELDFARDHSAVTQEELDSQTNIEMSRTMYLMSLIMVIFTPLTFLTGLLGANVGGIPLGNHPSGFWVVTLVLVVVAVLQMIILKKIRWF
ncbi:MAG: hypothetical protein II942_02620 [Alphaproteobacteria bacterium]|nr:hypothetical protein [Alphaproteobacteria bacterium]